MGPMIRRALANGWFPQMGKWQHVKAIIALPGSVVVFIPATLAILLNDFHFGWIPEIGWDLGTYSSFIPILSGTTPMCVGLLILIKTNVQFSSIGEGTLAPWNPTRRLIVAGIYRHVRNPMRIGVYFVLFGESILFGSTSVLVWFLSFAIFNHLYIVKKEEPGLVKRFGSEYLE
nr:methyltransferase [Candidatus Njordarchaeota archaeon]